MERDVDVLIPAAVEKSIHRENAGNIKAKIIGEAANGPTTVMTEKILLDNNKLIIPDMVLNGGGVTVSYFEWLKNISHVVPGRLTKRFDEQSRRNLFEMIQGEEFDSEKQDQIRGASESDIVYSGLEEIMCKTIDENWTSAEKYNNNMRIAAHVIAIERVAKAYEHCGLLI